MLILPVASLHPDQNLHKPEGGWGRICMGLTTGRNVDLTKEVLVSSCSIIMMLAHRPQLLPAPAMVQSTIESLAFAGMRSSTCIGKLEAV